jgi:heme A synthase
VASALIIAAAGHVFYHHRLQRELVRPAILLLVLLAAQITLGAFTVLTAKHYIINSLHVVTGASVLATSLVLTLRTHRDRLTAALRSASPSAASHSGMAHGGAKAGARA